MTQQPDKADTETRADTPNVTEISDPPNTVENTEETKDGGNLPPSETANEETEPDSFPRSYVEELRQENGKYRQRAQQADDLAHRLHTELVRASGKLADPTDLPFDDAHLHNEGALAAAIDDLLDRKPHLASRRPAGDIGQGASGANSNVDLAAILRQRAG